MSRTATPSLFSIPAGQPFLDVLAGRILAGGFPKAELPPPDALALSRYTVLVPTRRAARTLADAFLNAADGAALLLPQIRPIGDVDVDELDLDGSVPDVADAAAQLPEAVDGMARKLMVVKALLDLSDPETPDSFQLQSPAQAQHLAAELTGLVDLFDTEGVDYSEVGGLVTEEFARHWSATLEVLNVVLQQFPEQLARLARIGPMQKRNLLLELQAERFENAPPEGPVIAAGSTGSIPATARLLKAIARLDLGAVVLPGLDLGLDEASWTALDAGHPQFGMKQLLSSIGADRMTVTPLHEARHPAGSAARFRFLNEVLRPADTTTDWVHITDTVTETDLTDALEDMSLIAAPGPREEATAIALILREALEVEGRTAALVTPDRALARRVVAELARWNIDADDSAGIPLGKTAAGRLTLLLLNAVAEGLAPVPLLACLKHPLARFGMPRTEVESATGVLELAALRGVRPEPGLPSLRQALSQTRQSLLSGGRSHRALKQLRDSDWVAAEDLLERMTAALAPLVGMFQDPSPKPFIDLVRVHLETLEAAVRTDGAAGREPAAVWSGDAGEALAVLFAQLLEHAEHAPDMTAGHYPEFLKPLVDGVAVRPRYRRHPRISIWGLLEARMLQADITVLGGLNETTWPPVATVDAWLNRPMRAELGLPPPERRIGLAAHDFIQAACAPKVYLTRCEKADGAPTVPSRWLLRMTALLDGLGRTGDLEPDPAQPWLSWGLGLDDTGIHSRIAPPAPKPPLEARPTRMSVTGVEKWVRDPYAIFARDILQLAPLDVLDAEPGAADRGMLIHDILHEFAERYPGPLGPDALDSLLAIGRQVFDQYGNRPGIRAFWWPRFAQAAAWYLDQERALRTNVVTQLTEIGGSREIVIDGQAFEITARADRIDRLSDGHLRIVDYKTGALPTQNQVERGFSPQLPLEAIIAGAGGFPGIDGSEIADLVYIGFHGGRDPGKIRHLKQPDELMELALSGLIERITLFRNPNQAYHPRLAVEFERHAQDYDHLARYPEWSLQRADSTPS